MATMTNTTRRDMLKTGGSVVALGGTVALYAPPAIANDNDIFAKENEYFSCIAIIIGSESLEWTAEEEEPHLERLIAVEEAMIDAKAHTLQGLMAKLRVWEHMIDPHDELADNPRLWEPRLILSLKADIERMAREAV